MFFDPSKYFVLKKDAPVWVDPNNIHVILEKPGPLYVVSDDQKILVGYGTEFKFRLPSNSTYAVLSPTCGGSYRCPNESTVFPNGVAFTNADKRPNLSAAEITVKRALMEMNRRERIRDAEMRAQFAEQTKQREENGLQEPEPIDSEATETETETQTETESEVTTNETES